ncbi:PP2C family protein-serine/threonine phosphatase [Haloglycomyces albus]|uniref:PP2C family protein-serine/threonine phosphatase n=1 Tax=Haloglycomyces albus TaxID=526067 RepID=UPI00046D6213|nr:PP2C family serine/threonine-protein phosphatase [Haloglycomyces albus]
MSQPKAGAQPTIAPMKCSQCDLPAEIGRYCEACGGDLVNEATPFTPPDATAALPTTPPTGWKSSSPRVDNPEHPGGSDDHIDFVQRNVAAGTDVGKRHHYNQDAVAIGHSAMGHAFAVVCDGVSGATDSERAALAGVEASAEAMSTALDAGERAETASQRAVEAAHRKVAEVGEQYPDSPPSSTYVSAVVEGNEVIVCWVGDSRVYWAGAQRANELTVDDTIAARLDYQGADPNDERYRSPYAKALLAWLGADAPQLNPNLIRTELDGGHVIVCSDGLSRYLGQAQDLVPLPNGDVSAKTVALMGKALQYGGHDNISVAVIELSSPQPKGEPVVDIQEGTTKLRVDSEAEGTTLLRGGR